MSGKRKGYRGWMDRGEIKEIIRMIINKLNGKESSTLRSTTLFKI